MTGLDGFYAGATILSLLAMGYGIGAWHQRRMRAHESLIGALDRVKAALSSIQFHEFRALPNSGHLGSQLTLEYTIESRLKAQIEIWLGADIEYRPGVYFYDISQDKVVTLEPGRQVYRRYLTIAAPLQPGPWRLNGGIWFGEKSLPEQSIRLMAKATMIEAV